MDILQFVTAGNAHFTIQSLKTGKHYTYTVRQGFVRVLTGQDNTRDYLGIGILRGGRVYSRARHPAALALDWVLCNPNHPELHFAHAGRCGRCGRLLTTPESLALGLGPECATK